MNTHTQEVGHFDFSGLKELSLSHSQTTFMVWMGGCGSGRGQERSDQIIGPGVCPNPRRDPVCVCVTADGLPLISGGVRQKQRLSVNTLPPELKAPLPPEPVIPPPTKTCREFQ